MQKIKAQYWSKINDTIQCNLCPRKCHIKSGHKGFCRVRHVEENELIAGGYGKISSAHLDPIEKKPLYHFFPGSFIFSIGGWGCNFGCIFCQNWTISQQFIDNGSYYSPEQVVETALSLTKKDTSYNEQNIGIAYTYNEPLINYEFIKECASLAHQKGLKNVLVTNGYINLEPAKELLPLIDAMNVDIKSMDDSFYIKYCKANLQPVLDFIKLAFNKGCHIEITNLVIPTLNDKEELFSSLAEWIKNNLSEDIPLHLSAYHPDYKANFPPTPYSTLERAYKICKSLLKFVYLGNVPSSLGRDTICPVCGTIIISRYGFHSTIKNLKNRFCPQCNTNLYIIH